jgi:hypothetical protein
MTLLDDTFTVKQRTKQASLHATNAMLVEIDEKTRQHAVDESTSYTYKPHPFLHQPLCCLFIVNTLATFEYILLRAL